MRYNVAMENNIELVLEYTNKSEIDIIYVVNGKEYKGFEIASLMQEDAKVRKTVAKLNAIYFKRKAEIHKELGL